MNDPTQAYPAVDLHLAARFDQIGGCVNDIGKLLDVLCERTLEKDCVYDATLSGNAQRIEDDLQYIRDRVNRLVIVTGKKV